MLRSHRRRESREDRFGPRDDRSESLHDLVQSWQDVEKSSHVLEEAVAVLPVFRESRSGFRHVIEKSLHVLPRARSCLSDVREGLEELRACRELSFDDRRDLLAALEESVEDVSGPRACRLRLKSSV